MLVQPSSPQNVRAHGRYPQHRTKRHSTVLFVEDGASDGRSEHGAVRACVVDGFVTLLLVDAGALGGEDTSGGEHGGRVERDEGDDLLEDEDGY